MMAASRWFPLTVNTNRITRGIEAKSHTNPFGTVIAGPALVRYVNDSIKRQREAVNVVSFARVVNMLFQQVQLSGGSSDLEQSTNCDNCALVDRLVFYFIFLQFKFNQTHDVSD